MNGRVLALLALIAFVAIAMWLLVPHSPPQPKAPPPIATDRPQWELAPRTKESGCVGDRDMPDAACTPGAVFAEATLEQICTPHYTAGVRDVPLSVRKKAFAAYGIPMERAGEYELDHHISLELGGSNDIANLWPEAYGIPDGARVKDVVENYLHRQICQGKMSLKEAQYRIATDWKAVHRQMPPSKHRKRSARARYSSGRSF